MRWLKQYLKKHGEHFTEALVKDSIPIKWKLQEIKSYIKDEVWFNCWSATEGDMLYLVNMVYYFTGMNKRKCISFMLQTVGDYDSRKKWFDAWVLDNEGFDLRLYL